MRIVLDTNVVISALLWGGAPTRLLRAGEEPDISLWSSRPLLEELAKTHERRKFDKQIAASSLAVSALVERYAGRVTLVRPLPVPRIAPDPDDDVVVGTALAAEASLVVTGDRELLSVGQYEAVRIVTVTHALALHGLD